MLPQVKVVFQVRDGPVDKTIWRTYSESLGVQVRWSRRGSRGRPAKPCTVSHSVGIKQEPHHGPPFWNDRECCELSVIRLSSEATQALLNCVSSRNSTWGANFLLIEANGTLRKAGPAETVDWLQAVSWALAETLIIYNTRSHTITHLVPAQTRRSLKGNPGSFLYKPADVELHGPTLHRAPVSAGREIIKSGTYTWEEK